MFGKDYVVLLVFLLSVSRGVSRFDHALVLVSFAGVVSLGCFEFGSACLRDLSRSFFALLWLMLTLGVTLNCKSFFCSRAFIDTVCNPP
jgi:hypothetical protein